MRSTGLKDNGGQELFEDDLIEYFDPRKEVNYRLRVGIPATYWVDFTIYIDERCKIIGNIFENEDIYNQIIVDN